MNVDLRLRVVTPAFLGSFKPNEPEARIPPIRGAMRYWLRALIGGAIGTNNLARLHEVEESVFGSTRGNSPVTVRLMETTDLNRGDAKLLPHRDTGDRKAMCGGRMKLRIAAKPLVQPAPLEMALWASLMWLTLGGLGCRSRRGAGSLRLEAADTTLAVGLSQSILEVITAWTTRPANGPALASLLYQTLNDAHQYTLRYLQLERAAANMQEPSFPVLPPCNALVRVWRPVDDEPLDAEKALMTCMSERKAALGERRFADAFGGITPRRASPLHATIHQTDDGPVVVLTYLAAKNPDVNDLFNTMTPSWPVCPDSGVYP